MQLCNAMARGEKEKKSLVANETTNFLFEFSRQIDLFQAKYSPYIELLLIQIYSNNKQQLCNTEHYSVSFYNVHL